MYKGACLFTPSFIFLMYLFSFAFTHTPTNFFHTFFNIKLETWLGLVWLVSRVQFSFPPVSIRIEVSWGWVQLSEMTRMENGKGKWNEFVQNRYVTMKLVLVQIQINNKQPPPTTITYIRPFFSIRVKFSCLLFIVQLHCKCEFYFHQHNIRV